MNSYMLWSDDGIEGPYSYELLKDLLDLGLPVDSRVINCNEYNESGNEWMSISQLFVWPFDLKVDYEAEDEVIETEIEVLSKPQSISANPDLCYRPVQMLLAQLGNEPKIVQTFTGKLFLKFVAVVNSEGGIINPNDVWARFAGPYTTNEMQFELIARESCEVFGCDSDLNWLPFSNAFGQLSLSYAVALLYCAAKEDNYAAQLKVAKAVGKVALVGLGAVLGWFFS